MVNFRPRPIAKQTLLENKLGPKFDFTGNTATKWFMQLVKLKLYIVVFDSVPATLQGNPKFKSSYNLH